VATRSLLTIEGNSVALIVILVVVIFVRLIAGSTPDGHDASLGDAFRLPSGTTLDAIAVNAFLYPGTIGVLSLMVAYIATNLGAIRHLFLGHRRPAWQIVFPVLGIAFLVFTIYKNVAGTSTPYDRFPWIVLAWLAVGALIVAVAPHLVRRIGERLTSEIGDPPRQ